MPLAETACELMFQVIADRAEKAAVIVTTNLPFSEWSQVIPNPRLCKALIDRLTDRARTLGQHVVPDPPGTVRPVAVDEAGLDLRAENFVAARPSTGRADKPGMKATARDTERLAKPPHRPDPSMFRNEAEFHSDSLAK